MKQEVLWKNPGYRASKSLTGIHETKYLIVGAGITGLMTAYFLIRNGVKPKDILVVERDVVGSGSTGRSAGMLVPETETMETLWWNDFSARYGIPVAKAYRTGHRDALRTVEKLIRTYGIRCDAQKEDLLVLADTPAVIKRLTGDAAARRIFHERASNLRGTYLSREIAAAGFQYAERTVPALSVNPLALVQGIATALRSEGVHIFEHSELMGSSGRTARFRQGAVHFETIIRTTGVAARDKSLKKFVTTIAATKSLPPAVLRTLKLSDRDMFLDEGDAHSYHYAKVTGDNRIIIGYGDVLHKGESANVPLHTSHLSNIMRFLSRTFPKVKLPIEYAWSGVYALSTTGLPYVKVGKKETVINGAGIQLGSILAAEYAVTRLLNKKHPLTKLFAP